MNILDLIQEKTGYTFRKASSTEYCGPCPFCRAGDDRFILWPTGDKPRYWCRICKTKGDAIQFCRDYMNMGYHEAREYLGLPKDNGVHLLHHHHQKHHYHQKHHHHHNASQPVQSPGEQWTERAWAFVFDCQARLMESSEGEQARAWLHSRGLSDKTLWAAGFGYCPADTYEERSEWGLAPEMRKDGRPKGVWLPLGVVIPWRIDGELWGVRIRRPSGDPKYYWIPGGTATALYGADTLRAGKPAVLVEGEIDALTIRQQAGELVSVVATGSTTGARRAKWIARLSLCSDVLVAYDTDDAGEKAAQYWLGALKNVRRWRPYWSDANDMAQDGVNLQAWVRAGLQGNVYSVEDSGSTSVHHHHQKHHHHPIHHHHHYDAAATLPGLGIPLLRDRADAVAALAEGEGIQLQWFHCNLNNDAGWQKGRAPR